MSDKENLHITPVMEDYLETIAAVSAKNGKARVTDLSIELSVSKPTVTEMLNNLIRLGFIQKEPYGPIELTDSGKKIAAQTQKKHNALIKLLNGVFGVDMKIAQEDACKLEHSLSSQSYLKLSKFVEFIETCPNGKKPEWISNFEYYVQNGKHKKVR